MTPDSSPEPARTWPGATASTSTTSHPASAQWRASEAPNTPAPTTMSEVWSRMRRRLGDRGAAANVQVFGVSERCFLAYQCVVGSAHTNGRAANEEGTQRYDGAGSMSGVDRRSRVRGLHGAG